MQLFIFTFVTAVFSAPLGLVPNNPMELIPHHTSSSPSLLEVTGGKEKIFELIERLRDDNNLALQQATDSFNEAQANEVNKKHILEDLLEEGQWKLGVIEEKKSEIHDLQLIEHQKRINHEHAMARFEAARDAANAAAKFLSEENSRIDDEKSTLEEVLALLDQLSLSVGLIETDLLDTNVGRKLLSIVDLSSLTDADPAAITEVRQMINQLINVGEADRERAQDANKAAQDKFAAAASESRKTEQELAYAVGAVSYAQEELLQLLELYRECERKIAIARADYDDAVFNLDSSTAHLRNEEDRVKHEESIFVKVSNLLATLK